MPKYAEILQQAFDSPLVERFQTRGARRGIVLALFAVALSSNAVAFAAPAAWWAWGPLLLLMFPCAAFLNMSVRGVTEIPIGALDERFAQIRARAFHDAYYLGVFLAAAAGIAIANLWPFDLRHVPFGACAAGIAAGLPATLLAWRLPDEETPDAEAERAVRAGA